VGLCTCPEGCPETPLIVGWSARHDFEISEELIKVSWQPGRAWRGRRIYEDSGPGKLDI